MADSKLADLTAATTLASGDLLYAVVDPAGTPLDRKITADNAATALAGLAGYTLIDDDGATVTSGDITLNSTAIADLSATQLTLSGAVSGDVVYFGLSAYVSAAAQFKGFDVYTYPSGSRTNAFGVGVSASLASTQGQPGWLLRNVSEEIELAGVVRKVLVSGDISGGTVVVGMAYAGTSSTSRTLRANANTSLNVFAQLWRPPT